jgi:hypothetical protein
MLCNSALLCEAPDITKERWDPITQQCTAVSQKTRIHSSKSSDKYPSKIIADILLTKYFHLMYQVNVLTVHDITVITLLHHAGVK